MLTIISFLVVLLWNYCGGASLAWGASHTLRFLFGDKETKRATRHMLKKSLGMTAIGLALEFFMFLALIIEWSSFAHSNKFAMAIGLAFGLHTGYKHR